MNAKYWSIINLWYCSSQITWPQATWFHTFWFIWANGIIDETQWILKDLYNPTLYYFPPTWIGLLVWNGPTWYFFHYIFKTEYILLLHHILYKRFLNMFNSMEQQFCAVISWMNVFKSFLRHWISIKTASSQK